MQATTDWALVFQYWDESFFSQINVEWCDLSTDLWFFQRCRNFVLSSVHFEGVTLRNSSGMFRPYENCTLTAHGVIWTNSALVADGGRKSVIRPSQPTDAPIMMSIDGLRVHSFCGTAAAVCLLDLATDANSTVSRFEITNYSTIDNALIGEPIFVDDPNSPNVVRLNDTFFKAAASDTSRLYRPQASMPRDAVTTNNEPGFVPDPHRRGSRAPRTTRPG